MIEVAKTAIRRAAYAGRWVVANIIPLLLIIVIAWNAYATSTHISLPAHHVQDVRFYEAASRLGAAEARLQDMINGKTGDRWALTKQMAPWSEELYRRNPELDVPLPSMFQDPR
jgi:hypothetical protein